MSKLFIRVWLLMLVTCYQLSAQQFTIVETDASAYPVVKSRLRLPGNVNAQQSDFRLSEDGQEVPFSLSPAPAGTPANQTAAGKTVFFLVEASGNTYGGATENFKKAISDALTSLGANDYVNIAYFGKAGRSSGMALNVLSAEFTTDKDILRQEMQSKVNAAQDTNYQSDLFKAIYEALDFMASRQGLPENKVLIVLSAAINNSRSPIKAEDCIDKSQKANIPVYAIAYKTSNRYAPDNFRRITDQTSGKTATAKTPDEISEALSSFMNASAAPAPAQSKDYILQFTSNAYNEAEVKSYSIEYKGEKATQTYQVDAAAAGAGGGFLKKYGIALLLGLLAAGALTAWLLMASRKKQAAEAEQKAAEQQRLREAEDRNRALQEELRRQQQTQSAQAQKPQDNSPQKFDPKKTVISGGGAAPQLVVSAGNFSKSFPINKMSMSIGRGNDNDVVIPETTVSTRHALLVNEGGHFYLQDQGSTNGTFVNGSRINRQLLKSGDIIKMGAANIRFQL